MLIPTLCALLTKLLFSPKVAIDLHFRKCDRKYILWALLVPILYNLLAYMVLWLWHPDSFHPTLLLSNLPLLIPGIPFAFITALFEEIGWRGFLLPAMYQKWGIAAALILSAIIWWLWHLPLVLTGLYQHDAPLINKTIIFALAVLFIDICLAVIMLRSNSVWPATILHATHNYIDQMVLGPITSCNDRLAFVSETGYITLVWLFLSMLLILFVFPIREEYV